MVERMDCECPYQQLLSRIQFDVIRDGSSGVVHSMTLRRRRNLRPKYSRYMFPEKTYQKSMRPANEVACRMIWLYGKALYFDEITCIQICIHVMDSCSEMRRALHDRMICDLSSSELR